MDGAASTGPSSAPGASVVAGVVDILEHMPRRVIVDILERIPFVRPFFQGIQWPHAISLVFPSGQVSQLVGMGGGVDRLGSCVNVGVCHVRE